MLETDNSRRLWLTDLKRFKNGRTSSCKAEAEEWLLASLKFKFPISSDDLLMKKVLEDCIFKPPNWNGTHILGNSLTMKIELLDQLLCNEVTNNTERQWSLVFQRRSIWTTKLEWNTHLRQPPDHEDWITLHYNDVTNNTER